jgi:hypothetical protein
LANPIGPPPGYTGPTGSLQKHVAGFDPNNTGLVTSKATAEGLMKMGVSPAWSKFIGAVINAGLGPSTGGNLSTTVIPKITQAEHEGDTGVFTPQGTFSASRLDQIMTGFDRNKDNALSLSEIHQMQFNGAHTPKGAATTKLEFGLLLSMFADTKVLTNGKEEPALSKGQLTKFYDGSLFADALKNGGVKFNQGLFAKELANAAGSAVEAAVGWGPKQSAAVSSAVASAEAAVGWGSKK